MHDHTQIPLLDSIEELKKQDTTNTLGSIEQTGNQIQEIWDVRHSDTSNKDAKQAAKQPYAHIVVCGMGGSTLGTDSIISLFSDVISAPITIVPDYTLPTFVGKDSLVIAASYSGSTAETWSAIQEAHSRGAYIAGITSGGKIGDFLEKHSYPHITFSETYNPSKIAKMGLGYSIFGQMMLFDMLGILSITQNDLQVILDAIATAHLKMSISVAQKQNIAKILAFQLVDRIPYIMAAEHLAGAAHIFTNQLNENAKTIAEYHIIPELNHHLLEALSHPTTVKDHMSWISLQSDLYQPENHQRIEITQEALAQANLIFTPHIVTEKTKIGQFFEILMLGTYTSFYLAMLNQVDPGPIPTVDWFKNQLQKK